MANLKVTIREELTLNGYDQGAKNTLTISDVDEVFKRIVTCPANNETTIARFRSSVGNSSGTATFDSALDVQDVKYVRLTNLDSSNSLNLSLQIEVGEDDTGADTSATVLVEAGKIVYNSLRWRVLWLSPKLQTRQDYINNCLEGRGYNVVNK